MVDEAAERLTAARSAISEVAHRHALIAVSTERFQPGRPAGPIVAVKDLIDVRGLPTTGGSVSRAASPASRDAPVITHVRAAGGIVIGKANLYEWAFGVTGHNHHFGDTVNPRDRGRTTGGSSGGSAVAVATGMCDWAIGTDTGGSIRIPASLCGVVGFKPTRGLLSTDGVLPLSPSLDTVGPLARNVAVAASALGVLAGDPLALDHDLRPRLAVPRGWVDERGLDAQTGAVWRQLASGLAEVDLPALEHMSAAAIAVLEWEALAVHEARLEREPESYGPEVRARLERVIAARSAGAEEAYGKAIAEMSQLGEGVESALEGWDALILPASASVAPLLGEHGASEPLVRFMRPFNLSGHPVIVIPAPASGLPVGVQLVGRLGEEAWLASVALALERAWAAEKSEAEPSG